MELAVATHTAPRDWWDEDDRTLATALDLLDKQASELEKGARRGRRTTKN